MAVDSQVIHRHWLMELLEVLVVVVVVLSPIDLKQQNQTTKPFVDSHPESY